MKALSIWQPWASFIVHGLKTIETRRWRTHHVGPLLIHASKKSVPELDELATSKPYESLMLQLGYHGLHAMPRGVLLGEVNLLRCERTETLIPQLLDDVFGAHEALIGNYEPGRWGWILSSPQPFVCPIPRRGERGLFEVEEHAQASLPYMRTSCDTTSTP